MDAILRPKEVTNKIGLSMMDKNIQVSTLPPFQKGIIQNTLQEINNKKIPTRSRSLQLYRAKFPTNGGISIIILPQLTGGNLNNANKIPTVATDVPICQRIISLRSFSISSCMSDLVAKSVSFCASVKAEDIASACLASIPDAFKVFTNFNVSNVTALIKLPLLIDPICKYNTVIKGHKGSRLA